MAVLGLAGDFGDVVAGSEDAEKCVEGCETDGKEHEDNVVVGIHILGCGYVFWGSSGEFGCLDGGVGVYYLEIWYQASLVSELGFLEIFGYIKV